MDHQPRGRWEYRYQVAYQRRRCAGNVSSGKEPRGCCFRRFFGLGSEPGHNNISRLRASDGHLLGTFAVGVQPQFAVFDGESIWVTNQASNSVTKLSACDGSRLGTFLAGEFPNGIAFDGANVWVSNQHSHTLSKM